MDKLQYDSFHKFMVSLGIVLIALPIIAYIFFIKYEPIILTQNEFNNLSVLSLKNISYKEKIIEIFTRCLPYISVILFLLGACCVIFGVIGWRKIQKNLDAQIEYDTTMKKISAKKMSASEIVLKAAEEVSEIEQVDECEKVTNNVSNKMLMSQNYMLNYMRIEDLCFSKLLNQYSKKYDLKRYLRIGKYEYDFIGISKKDNIDLIFEVKYWRQIPSRQILERILQRLLLSGENYKSNVCRDFKMILVIVAPREKINKIKSKIVDKDLNLDIRYFIEEELLMYNCKGNK